MGKILASAPNAVSVSLRPRARSRSARRSTDYLAKVARPYKNVRSDRIRNRALRVHFAPLHSRDVTLITVADVAGILQALAPETAIKSHTVIRAVFDYAATMLEPHGVRMVNPADPRRLRSLGWASKSRSESKPHPSVRWTLMPEVVAELSRTADVDASCIMLIVATAVRAGTARLAKWGDFDLEKRIWTPPLADLKDGKHHQRPFVVPLNSVALDALERCASALRRVMFSSSAAAVRSATATSPISFVVFVYGMMTGVIQTARSRLPFMDFARPFAPGPRTSVAMTASSRSCR